ncbi:branched-chain amino acid transaminase [Candidatus Micrarchaeota archaeon]|nr:branched-chain amino acid transaminase [Candidatus Micrarchaeota archaeon]
MALPKLPSKIWLNGKLVPWKSAKIHVLTHALHYGTAIFEGMRCYSTIQGPAVFRMSDHYNRLISGAKSYQFKVNYSQSQLCLATKNLIRKNHLSECYLRPICYAGYKGIGLDISDAPFEFAIIPYPMGNLFGDKSRNGISCGISSWARIDSRILSPHVKASANYLNSVLAKLEAKNAGYDEAVMLSEEGHVSEGSGENLFMVKDEILITPPLHDGILAGITRDSIIELARELGISVEERSILRDELYGADELFLCGTAAEITPVKSIDRRKISRGPGKMTKELHDAFFAIVSGKDERFVRWLDFV